MKETKTVKEILSYIKDNKISNVDHNARFLEKIIVQFKEEIAKLNIPDIKFSSVNYDKYYHEPLIINLPEQQIVRISKREIFAYYYVKENVMNKYIAKYDLSRKRIPKNIKKEIKKEINEIKTEYDKIIDNLSKNSGLVIGNGIRTGKYNSNRTLIKNLLTISKMVYYIQYGNYYELISKEEYVEIYDMLYDNNFKHEESKQKLLKILTT